MKNNASRPVVEAAPDAATLQRAGEAARRAWGIDPNSDAPTREEAHNLIVSLGKCGLIDLEFQAKALGDLKAHDDPNRRALAIDGACREAAPRAATRALEFPGANFQPNDWIELSSLQHTGGRRSCFGRLSKPDERARLETFIAKYFGRADLYIGAQPRTEFAARKNCPARTEGIAAQNCVVADFDPPKDMPASEWPEWRAGVIAKLEPTLPVALVESGRGVQAWWRVVRVEDQIALMEQAKTWGSVLAEIVSDAVGDLPHIMRLAFTVNSPKPEKRKAGARLALALPVKIDTSVQPRALDAIAQELRTAFGVAGKNAGDAYAASQAEPWANAPQAAATTPTPKASSETHTVPSAAPAAGATPGAVRPVQCERAPNFEVLEELVDLIPNDGTAYADRGHWIGALHDWRDAGSDWPNKTRALALRWCAQHPTSDPAKDARAYDTLGPTTRPPNELRGFAKLLERAAIENRNNSAKFAKVRQIAAKFGFDDFVDDKSTGANGGTAVRKLLQALDAAGIEAFRNDEAVVLLKIGDFAYAIEDEGVLIDALSRLGQFPPPGAVSHLEQLLKGRARQAPKRDVAFRVQFDPGSRVAFLDLGDADKDKTIVKIEAGGWTLGGTSAKRLFGRDDFLLGMSRPCKSASTFIDLFAKFVTLPPVATVAPDDPGTQARIKLIAFVASVLLPSGARPHLLIHGPQGSGKTTCARRLKELLDPNSGGETKNADDLNIVGRGQSFMIWDNASKISLETSDGLATLATGSGTVKRKMRTNGGKSQVKAKLSIILTSILEDIATRPDLIDRFLTIELTPPKRFIADNQLDKAWDAVRSELLGAALDIAVGALKHWDTAQATLDKHPRGATRLADLSHIAEAAAQGAGYPPGLAIEVLHGARDQEALDRASADPIAHRLARAWLDAGDTLHLSASDLLDALNRVSAQGVPSGPLPSNPRAFGHALQRLAPMLKVAAGIEVQQAPIPPRGRRGWLVQGNVTKVNEFLGAAPKVAPNAANF